MILQRRAFWFLRHGETDWNARQLSQGSVDVPLNETGLAQAHAAAARLVGLGICAIRSSPLSRARATAEIAAAALGLPIVFDEELREAAYGVREGQPMTDWFGRWIDGLETPDSAEPFATLRARAVGAIDRATEPARPQPVLVVAHGGLFRALRASMGLAIDVRTPNAVPILCSPAADGWTPSSPGLDPAGFP
jgi:broad specificity phosphatase PhoE